jgi:hypothetical protein
VYEAKSGANFSIFNVDAAKEVKKVEALATGREDFKEYCLRFDNDQYPACRTVDWSPLRFLYASEFNVDAAKAVIAQLKKPDVIEAHKIMRPCVDAFRMMTPPSLWPDPVQIDIHHRLSAATGGNVTASDSSFKMMSAMSLGRSYDIKNSLTDAQEQASWGLSRWQGKGIGSWQGKGTGPGHGDARQVRGAYEGVAAGLRRPCSWTFTSKISSIPITASANSRGAYCPLVARSIALIRMG